MSVRHRLATLLLAPLLAATSVTATSGPAAAADLPAPEPGAEVINRPTDGTFTVQGGGYGHGIGMSQYGAHGAGVAGVDYEDILSFYYPGTSLEDETPPRIRVGLTVDDDNIVTVEASDGLAVNGNGVTMTLPEDRTRWQARLADNGGECRLQGRTDSGWTAYPLGGDETFGCPVTFSTPEDQVRLVLPGGDVRTYRGVIRAAASEGQLLTTNHLNIDLYLRSVVPAESPAYFHQQALQAQSVAARTYARYHSGAHERYDVCDTTACQVYRGMETRHPGGGITPHEFDATTTAVGDTAGQVLQYGGNLALTMFSSSNGGHTAPGGLDYLPGGTTDPYDDVDNDPDVTNARHEWATTLSADTLGARYGIGQVERIQILSRDGHGRWGGRVGDMRIEGFTGGAYERVDTRGANFRFANGLNSHLFRITGAPWDTDRLQGGNRYGTAATIAAEYGAGVDVAYVATGQDYPDALAGAALAGRGDGPVLLTRPAELPGATIGALQDLQPQRIVVLGGDAVVDGDVVDALAEYASGGDDAVSRIAEGDRYGTAAAISRGHAPRAGVAYLATGQAYPDALTGAALAGSRDAPVLLTRTDRLPAVTRAELERLQPQEIVILGGTGAVSNAVERELGLLDD